MKSDVLKKWVSLFLSLSLIFTSGAFDGVSLSATDEDEVNDTEETVEVVQVQEETVEVEEEVKEEEPESAPVENEEETEIAEEEKPEAPVEEVETEKETPVETEDTEDETSETVKTAENEEEAEFAVYEDNEVKVTVTGAIPQNAKLDVTAITMENEPEKYDEVVDALNNSEVSVGAFRAYDIKFVDEAGNEVEPTGEVSVKIEPKEALDLTPSIVVEGEEAAAPSEEDISVLHLEENKKGEVVEVVDLSETKELDEVNVNKKGAVEDVTFTTSSFSVYVVNTTTANATINVGDTVNVTCTRSHNHDWTSSKGSVATVSGTGGNTAVITGVSEDTATIQCNGTGSFTVTVVKPLTPVATVDSKSMGVTIKMIDLTQDSNSTRDLRNGDYDVDMGGVYTVDGASGRVKQGLLSNTLTNGYPTSIKDGQSLSGLFSGATEVNHLFLQSVYNSTGYLKYASFDNYAYLEDDGNFTVYEEIGTPSNGNNFFYKRGNFMPYNKIEAGKYSTNTNDYDNNGNALKTGDPRKGEQLYITQGTNDFYFGMEIDADFYQTENGKDKNNNDLVYDFNGDDDLWVYVDDVLLLDIGGVSDAHSGQINFATGQIWVETGDGKVYTTIKDQFQKAGVFPDGSTWDNNKVNDYFDGNTFIDNSNHTFKMFYFERGDGASNLEMSMNLITFPKGTVVGSKTWIELDGKTVNHNNATELDFELQRKEEGQADSEFKKVEGAVIKWGYQGNPNLFYVEDMEEYAGQATGHQGKKYIYRVVEKNDPEGYVKSYGSSLLNIVNTATNDFKGTKVWQDPAGTQHDNPTEVNLTLHRYYTVNGTKTGDEVVTGKQVTWSGNTFTYSNLDSNKLVVLDNGSTVGYPYTYYVTEASINKYVTTYSNASGKTDAVYNGGKVINTITGSTSVSGAKTWVDDNNADKTRPDSITIKLLADGKAAKDADDVAITANVSADTKGDWKWNFTDLPKYDAQGQIITYTVEEEAIENYTTTYDDAHLNVTNTLKPGTTSVSGSKTWVDDDNADNTRPASITIKLLANGKAAKDADDVAITANVTADTKGEWKWNFTDLPKYDAQGKKITYTVEEKAIENYTTTYDATHMNVINTLKPGTTSVSGSKTWVDDKNADNTRPDSITINLLANGSAAKNAKDEAITAEVTADDNWAWEFTGLPKYDAQGKKIAYTVTEDAVDKYSTTYDADHLNVTNTLKPGTTSVSGTKTWDDANNQDGKRPTEITIYVKNGNTTVDTITLTAGEDKVWSDAELSWTSKSLPKYADGKLIKYTVAEEKVDGYDTVINGTSITNKHTPAVVSIPVSKEWVDGTDKYNKRPAEVTVNLLANKKKVDEVKLSDDNSWKYTFANKPKYADGKEIKYTITEETVENYDTVINGTEVTNTLNIPMLDVDKKANVKTGLKVGDVVTYTIVVSNVGYVKIHNIDVTDVMLNGGKVDWAKPEEATGRELEPGKSFELTATYVVTQADVDAQKPIENKATATGLGPKGEKVSDDDNETVTTVQKAPAIAVEKKSELVKKDGNTVEGKGEVGDTIKYTVTVKNTGNATLKDIAITDTMSNGVVLTFDKPLTGITLEPGETYVVKADYVVTQADVDAEPGKDGKKHLLNEATAKSGTTVPDEPGKTDDEIDDDKPAIAVEKTSKIVKKDGNTVEGKGEVGDTIEYTVTVKNTGNVTLDNIEITDTMSNGVALTFDKALTGITLAPGKTYVVKADYVVTQADVDAEPGKDGKKHLLNEATAKSGNTEPDEPGKTDDEIDDDKPAIAVEKTSKLVKKDGNTVEGKGEVGDTIEYTVTVKNTGNVTLDNIEITDTMSNGVALTFDKALTGITLAPGKTYVVKADYVVTQADVDAEPGKDGKKHLLNEATAKSGNTVPDEPGKTDDEIDDDKPAIAVEKTSKLVKKDGNTVEGKGEVGDTIEYTVTVKNTGNVTLDNIEITDTMSNGVALTFDKALTGITLAPGRTYVVKADYVVTQADVDAEPGKDGKKHLLNEATAKSGNTEPDEPGKTDDEIDDDKPGIVVVKSATIKGGDVKNVGDVITYTVTAKNTGNVTLKNLTLSDALAPESGAKAVFTLVGTETTITSIAPGETAVTSYTYTVTQADIDAGEILNTAIVTGKDPKGNDVPGQDDYTVDTEDDDPDDPDNPVIKQKPAIEVVKTATIKGGDVKNVGDVITYTVTAKNTGNVTLKNLTLSDVLAPESGAKAVFTLLGTETTITSIAPGETAVTTYTYTVTQADIDKGEILNTAVVTGKDPKGNDVPGQDDYTVDTDDDDPDDPDNPVIKQKPAIEVVKSATIKGGDVKNVGDVITYTVTAKNTGNVTLKNLTLSDALAPESGAKAVFTLVGTETTITSIAPGETAVTSYTYTVTQADIDAGEILNTAIVTGKDPKGNDVPGQDDYTVDTDDDDPDDPDNPVIKQKPAIEVVKSATIKGGDVKNVGDVITYTVTAKNTGNVTLKNLTLSDALAPESGAKAVFTLVGTEKTITSIAPGETAVTTYTYTVTQADIDKGEILNTAIVTGKDPKGNDVPGQDDYTVDTEDDDPDDPDNPVIKQKPAIEVVKTATIKGGDVKNVGDVITYTVTAKNTGNVTLTNLTLSDALAPESGAKAVFTLVGTETTITSIAPGETAVTTYDYVVTQADIDAGEILNTAIVNSKDPKGNDVPGTDDYTVDTEDDDPDDPDNPVIVQNPAIVVEKTAKIAGGEVKNVGDVITYTVTAKNTGNVTLNNLTLSDALAEEGGAKAVFTLIGTETTITSIAPGETAVTTYDYVVTQADIDAGKILNTAIVTGKDPKGNDVPGRDDYTVDKEDDDPDDPDNPVIVQNPHLTVTKVADKPEVFEAGEVVTYTITVINDGNVTISNISIDDQMSNGAVVKFDKPLTGIVLAPGEKYVVTGKYTITVADIENAMDIENIAVTKGTTPDGEEIVPEPPHVTVKVPDLEDHDDVDDNNDKDNDNTHHVDTGDNSGNFLGVAWFTLVTALVCMFIAFITRKREEA